MIMLASLNRTGADMTALIAGSVVSLLSIVPIVVSIICSAILCTKNVDSVNGQDASKSRKKYKYQQDRFNDVEIIIQS